MRDGKRGGGTFESGCPGGRHFITAPEYFSSSIPASPWSSLTGQIIRVKPLGQWPFCKCRPPGGEGFVGVQGGSQMQHLMRCSDTLLSSIGSRVWVEQEQMYCSRMPRSCRGEPRHLVCERRDGPLLMKPAIRRSIVWQRLY